MPHFQRTSRQALAHSREPHRAWMGVRRYQRHLFNLGLGDEHAIKGVTVMERQKCGLECMRRADVERAYPSCAIRLGRYEY